MNCSSIKNPSIFADRRMDNLKKLINNKMVASLGKVKKK